MGTTLTGTTPQDTYDSLIKVTDNGPLSGTLKALSDGLGNDSTLSLSTTAASIAGTLAVTGNVTIDTSTLVVDAANNRVGVGVASPSHILDIQSTAPTLRIKNTTAPATGGTSSLLFEGINNFSGTSQSFINSIQAGNSGATQLAFGTGATGDATATERMRITATGNVGIGTSAPQQKLHLAGVADNSYGLLTTATNWANNIFTGVKIGSTGDTYSAGVDLRSYSHYSTSAKTALALWVNNTSNTMVEVVRATENGLTFNGDFAAANALDDYEEGTFTPTIIGTTTAGTATYVERIGTYTKIGNVVNFSVTMNYNSGTGTGNLRIGGLPFTSSSQFHSLSIGAFASISLTALHIATAFMPKSVQYISFEQYPTGGGGSIDVPFDEQGVILVSGSYTV